MSTFSGLLREIPHISVDCFDGPNTESQLFFLSHCHMDHLRGIATLKRPLYTSAISSVIVRKKFRHLQDIVTLDIGVPLALKYKSPDDQELSVVVTALPAGHMLGSIMLHFQTADQSVLYTGDFRLTRPDMERIKPLKLMAEAHSCNSIYVDSTFFSRQWPEFPPQQQSIAKIIELIRPWVQKSPNHMIELHTSATYGSERLFQKIHRELGLKIHVSSAPFEQYQYIPELDGVMSNDGRNLQIHACFGDVKESCLKEARQLGLVRTIRPSAMIWRQWQTGADIVRVDSEKYEKYRVCYSNHASYNEVRDLLLYLKATNVYLNVEKPDRASEMQALKEDIMKEYENAAQKQVTFCPFSASNAEGIRFSNAQSLSDYVTDQDFVVALPKRRRL